MISVLAAATVLAGAQPEYAAALETLFDRHRQSDSGEPFIRAQATADLNDDGILDGVIVFSYAMGPNMDHTHSEFLTIVSSSTDGYTASWPILVGARGFRNIRKVEVTGQDIVLFGDFTVSDETASMAVMPASGEVHYSIQDGKLREQRGYWERKPGE